MFYQILGLKISPYLKMDWLFWALYVILITSKWLLSILMSYSDIHCSHPFNLMLTTVVFIKSTCLLIYSAAKLSLFDGLNATKFLSMLKWIAHRAWSIQAYHSIQMILERSIPWICWILNWNLKHWASRVSLTKTLLIHMESACTRMTKVWHFH